ncbi:low-density lipoprotein receptor-like [Homarus americanus]|uniref:low-density lipoprotein receptor-like n=1 Tax=Homarus americanus TaxID=6706 RepID=UPI001C45B904|nr:low-density lipoprotein receptor-like [Homarus americanus]
MRSGGGVPLAALLLGLLLECALGVLAWEVREDFYGAGVENPEVSWGQKKEVKRVQPPNHDLGCSCSPEVLGCRDETGVCMCVDKHLVCNGEVDCPGGEDEVDCSPNQCTEFMCGSGRCVEKGRLCDGFDDCGDDSDEVLCKLPPMPGGCYPGQFNCSSGHFCISPKWRCDGDFDCQDKSDEANCTVSTCPASEHLCGDGHCIHHTWVCDKEFDCDDRSDELDCPTTDETTCTPDQVQCESGGRCVMEHYACDGENDCGDWSDEHDCNITTCAPDEFKCQSGKCIEHKWVCDYIDDCDDGEDEATCPHPSEDVVSDISQVRPCHFEVGYLVYCR